MNPPPLYTQAEQRQEVAQKEHHHKNLNRTNPPSTTIPCSSLPLSVLGISPSCCITPMESVNRSRSCVVRSSTAHPAPDAAPDLRCHSASYGGSREVAKVKRAKSTTAWSSWSRPSSEGGRSGGAVAPGLNLRCYSASYTASFAPAVDGGEVKRANSTPWSSSSSRPTAEASGRGINLKGYTASFAALSAPDEAKVAAAKSANWSGAAAAGSRAVVVCGGDAELQRKKRLAAYKVYDVEGKVKESLRRSVKWLKGKYARVVYGW